MCGSSKQPESGDWILETGWCHDLCVKCISERRMHIIAHDLALRIALLAECSPDSESCITLMGNGT